MVGACWLVSSDGKGPVGGSGSRRVSGEAAVPASLGPYQRFSRAARSTHATNADQIARRIADVDVKSTRLLSKAYGGAPAAVATYANAGLSEIFVLTVVRAVSPRPFTPYQNAAQLGLAKPAREVVTVGEVACLVHNQSTTAGKRPGPETVTVESCQRTGEGLTVQIRSVTGDIHSSPERIAALVDKAWSGLS
ncbi:hypothetical protein ACIRPT_40420 [Streptomyces sp. NPDC101227]|uniref:hypothetical protein n=1 Tax=Streptomyces sp. NPDC101227 TaxID=3366136 RepID=UPI003817E6E7